MEPTISSKKHLFLQIFSAVLFGTVSFLLVVINKVVLTSFKFPSYQFLGLGQIVATIVVLYFAKLLGIVTFPDFEKDTLSKIWPLPLLYLLNMIFGLGGTKKLNLPMFTVLRRFAIWFTMLLEGWILGVKATRTTQFCVFLMIFGALIAAIGDLTFDLVGYTFITLNNIYNAANGVYTKQKLDAKELGKYGLLFYNAFFSFIPICGLAYAKGEFDRVKTFEEWTNPYFLVQFLLSCFMGFVLMYSVVLCTHYNSALTTTIIGLLKNLLITYVGMVIGGDYVFSWLNFTGLNVSVVGSLVYTYVTFRNVGSNVPVEVITVKSVTAIEKRIEAIESKEQTDEQ